MRNIYTEDKEKAYEEDLQEKRSLSELQNYFRSNKTTDNPQINI